MLCQIFLICIGFAVSVFGSSAHHLVRSRSGMRIELRRPLFSV